MTRKGRYGQFIKSILTFADLILLNVVYLCVCLIMYVPPQFFCRQSWLILNFSYLIVAYIFSDIHQKRIVYADKVVLQAFKAVILNAAIFISLLSFINLPETSPKIFVIFYIVLFIVYSVWWIVSRKILKKYRTLGFNFRKVIIIGEGKIAVKLLDEMLSDTGYGYKVLGFFDDKKGAKSVKNYKGRLCDVEQFVKDNLIDEMYCAMPADHDEVMQNLIKIADSNAIDFYYVPQINNKFSRRFELYSIGNIPALALRPNPLNSMVNKILKRISDILFSSVFLILSPFIFVPVAIAIKLSSPGPILFKQKRTGYRGKEFTCYKFRTMRVNHDSDKMQATKNDPRKTRIGEILRKTSIDELPQFFNVWRGDMSIVGPRPHMLKHTEVYSSLINKYMVRHVIKPGITGWAQVNGYRGQTEQLWQMEKRVEYDVWYTENWNFLLDMKIVFLTVYNAVKGEKNAF